MFKLAHARNLLTSIFSWKDGGNTAVSGTIPGLKM